MKRKLAFLLLVSLCFWLGLLFGSVVFGQQVSQTPNLNLNLPPVGFPNWGNLINQNFVILDTATGNLQRSYRGNWNATTNYSYGQIVAYNGATYISLLPSNINQVPDAPFSTAWGKLGVTTGGGGGGGGNTVGNCSADANKFLCPMPLVTTGNIAGEGVVLPYPNSVWLSWNGYLHNGGIYTVSDTTFPAGFSAGGQNAGSSPNHAFWNWVSCWTTDDVTHSCWLNSHSSDPASANNWPSVAIQDRLPQVTVQAGPIATFGPLNQQRGPQTRAEAPMVSMSLQGWGFVESTHNANGPPANIGLGGGIRTVGDGTMASFAGQNVGGSNGWTYLALGNGGVHWFYGMDSNCPPETCAGESIPVSSMPNYALGDIHARGTTAQNPYKTAGMSLQDGPLQHIGNQPQGAALQAMMAKRRIQPRVEERNLEMGFQGWGYIGNQHSAAGGYNNLYLASGMTNNGDGTWQVWSGGGYNAWSQTRLENDGSIGIYGSDAVGDTSWGNNWGYTLNQSDIPNHFIARFQPDPRPEQNNYHFKGLYINGMLAVTGTLPYAALERNHTYLDMTRLVSVGNDTTNLGRVTLAGVTTDNSRFVNYLDCLTQAGQDVCWFNVPVYANTTPYMGTVPSEPQAARGEKNTVPKTPTASNTPCRPDEIWHDDNYLYVCIASGNVKRVALQSF